ncbi:TIGR01621 family pseudouridine synthase [Alteromonas halophila]|uniref:RNA pseudouridine synthase n=1 Tax=Alteromonas halophila TaxID=516698 RepID=A0A918JCE4_9ALTE|nr:TIGR01621 family pseudouridine synthase [Alteromonas halophila]GGW74193.1 RNA pseudouridine synthase [Alteromonas halophila]
MNTRFTRLVDHDDFIIINKPSGIPMHDNERGVISLLRQQTGESDWYLCHRLDTGTSGCLCIARTAEAAATMGALFAQTKIQKYYLALTTSRPAKKQGTIIGDMKNRRQGQHMLLKSRQNPAITQFFSYGIGQGIRGVIVRPYTGKTHQIRVAMKSIGSPIMGDGRYGGQQSDRLYLHAWQLGFAYQGKPVHASCLPDSGEQIAHPAVHNWLSELPAPDTLHWPRVKSLSSTGDIS